MAEFLGIGTTREQRIYSDVWLGRYTAGASTEWPTHETTEGMRVAGSMISENTHDRGNGTGYTLFSCRRTGNEMINMAEN